MGDTMKILILGREAASWFDGIGEDGEGRKAASAYFETQKSVWGG